MFEPMPATAAAADTPKQSEVKSLTISGAKHGLAHNFGILEEAFEIIIRG